MKFDCYWCWNLQKPIFLAKRQPQNPKHIWSLLFFHNDIGDLAWYISSSVPYVKRCFTKFFSSVIWSFWTVRAQTSPYNKMMMMMLMWDDLFSKFATKIENILPRPNWQYLKVILFWMLRIWKILFCMVSNHDSIPKFCYSCELRTFSKNVPM